jgi:hypothetical protein
MPTFTITYEYLSEIIVGSNYDVGKMRISLRNTFPELKTNDIDKIIKEIQHHFLFQLKKKWQDSHRKIDRFKLKNKDWLKRELKVSLEEDEFSDTEVQPPIKKRAGRPLKSFEECCDRTKRLIHLN